MMACLDYLENLVAREMLVIRDLLVILAEKVEMAKEDPKEI